MSYTLGQAAKATGKSKTTIQRAIAKGRISATKDTSGAYQIDPSELHRVFAPTSPETVPQPQQSNTTRPQDGTPVLQVKIDALEEMLAREREALDEIRTDRDAWKQQATSLLSAPPQKRRRWWQWK
ncbi:helix-turn-helix domain-containing protein [Epibacterium ulvae]|uniref:helix-turn-helix domain-containing protein n=1 Tax=Epibacterium ulvae TaxID=1156985 RepID=UPI000C228E43